MFGMPYEVMYAMKHLQGLVDTEEARKQSLEVAYNEKTKVRRRKMVPVIELQLFACMADAGLKHLVTKLTSIRLTPSEQKYAVNKYGTQGATQSYTHTKKAGKVTAGEILTAGAEAINNRAAERDTGAERSMKRCVNAFNALYDLELTEILGWQFMVMLKMSRAHGGDFRMDDYEDQASYSALAGESAQE